MSHTSGAESDTREGDLPGLTGELSELELAPGRSDPVATPAGRTVSLALTTPALALDSPEPTPRSLRLEKLNPPCQLIPGRACPGDLGNLPRNCSDRHAT